MSIYICGDEKKDIKLFSWAKEMLESGKTDPVKMGKIRAAITAFFASPKVKTRKKIEAFRAAIAGTAVSTDFPIQQTNTFNMTIEQNNFDMGWELAFRDVARDPDKDFWEIGTARSGITFRKMAEGQRVEVQGMNGEFALAYVDYYGGAFGWTDKMIRFRKMAQMINIATEFRNKFFENKADNHYALLAAAALANGEIPYQTTGATARVQRVVLTLNLAAYTLGNDNKDKGYGNTASAPLILYANPKDEEIIEAARRVTTASLASASGAEDGSTITQRTTIRPIYTFNSNIEIGKPLMVLPGHKLQKNEAMAPTSYMGELDPLTLNRLQAVWSIYGAAVADIQQVRKVAIA